MKCTLHHLGLGFALLSSASTAFATNSINVQTFNPSTSDRFVFLEDGFKADNMKPTKYLLGVNYNYLSEPLVVLDSTQTTKQYNLIDSIQTFDLFFGVKAASNVGLYIGTPIHYVAYPGSYPAASLLPNRASATVLGDLKLLAKIRLTEDVSDTALAIIPEIHLPTGGTADFVSDGSAYLGIRAAVERKFTNFTFVANLGYATASDATYSDRIFSSPIDFKKRFSLGVGGFLPFNDQWGMNVELVNTNSIPSDKNLNPNDLYGGLRYQMDSVAFTGGASIGRIGGVQGQDFRLVLGLRYMIKEEQRQAPQPIALAPIAPAKPVTAPAKPVAVAPPVKATHVPKKVVVTPIKTKVKSKAKPKVAPAPATNKTKAKKKKKIITTTTTTEISN